MTIKAQPTAGQRASLDVSGSLGVAVDRDASIDAAKHCRFGVADVARRIAEPETPQTG